MKLIIGLGNPGAKYAKNHHNVGFMVIEKLIPELTNPIEKKECQAITNHGLLDGEPVVLVRPQTFMNLSGDSVIELLNFYKNRITDFIVIHDDMDLAFGRLRFKKGGSAGGHNGIKSITQRLNSEDYDRLKIAIGRPPEKMAVVNYVLQNIPAEKMPVLNQVIDTAVLGIKFWVKEGIDKTANKYNGVNFAPDKENENR